MPDSINSNNNADRDIIKGWDAIAKYAGFSKRHCKNLEKLGLKVQRDRVRKNAPVWAYRQDIKDFVDGYEEEKNRDPEITQKPESENSPESRKGRYYLLALSFFLITAILLVVFWPESSQKTQSRELDFYFVERTPTNFPLRVGLYDNYGDRFKTVWQTPNGWSHFEALLFQRDNLQNRIQICKTSRAAPIVLECFSNELRMHTYNDSKAIELPNLGIKTMDGTAYPDIEFVSGVYRIQSPALDGWAFIVKDKRFFPSVLLLVDTDFKEVGRVYHAGVLFYLSQKNDSLIVSGALNAREKDGEPYRPVVFKLSIQDILGGPSQIIPFSANTIPTIARRNYYQFVDLPECPTITYIAFAPNSDYRYILAATDTFISIDSSFDFKKNIRIDFDWNLQLVNKFKMDHVFEADFKELYYSTRFQYWLGDEWSPWQAEKESLSFSPEPP